MSVFRSQTLTSIDNLFTQATLAWHQDAEKTGLDWYITKHGVFHLLAKGCIDEAKERLMDIAFIGRFLHDWENFVVPFKAIRLLGVREMRMNFDDLGTVVNHLDPTEQLCDHVDSLAVFLQKIGMLAQAQKMFSCLIGLCTKQFGQEHLKTIGAICNSATIHKYQGNVDIAEQLYRESLKLETRLWGENAHDVLITKLNLGSLLTGLGRYAEAETLLVDACQALESSVGEIHPDTSIAYGNLGTLYEAKGNFKNAEVYYRKAHQSTQDFYGEDAPDTLICLSNLGLFYSNNGNLTIAKDILQKVLSIRTQKFGEYHPATINSISLVASIFRKLGNLDHAEKLYLKAKEISQQVSGFNHPRTLNILGNLGYLYWYNYQEDKAEQCYKDALLGYKALYGEEHPDVLWTLEMLARIYVDKKQFVKAEDFYQKVILIQTKMFGEFHKNTFVSKIDLGTCYIESGHLDKAEQYLIGLLFESRQSSNNLDKAYQFRCQEVLGDVYLSQQQFDLAEKMYWEVYCFRKKEFGILTESTQTVYEKLIDAYIGQEKNNEVEKGYQTLIGLKEQEGFTNQIQIAIWLNNFAWWQLDNGRIEAVKTFSQVRQYYTENKDWEYHWAKLGEDLGRALSTTDFSGAKQVLGELVALLGPNHARIEKAQHKIQMVQQMCVQSR